MKIKKVMYKQPLDPHLMDEFIIDCQCCSGICCAALYFSKMDGFPQDKKAGVPCVHLCQDGLCAIHSDLTKRRLTGCIQYDCLGAGQIVTQSLYPNTLWQDHPNQREQLFSDFVKVFQLQQMRWYLLQCTCLNGIDDLLFDMDQLLTEIKSATISQECLKNCLLSNLHERTNLILKEVSRRFSHQWSDQPKKPMFSKKCDHQQFIETDFSMSLLIGSDFKKSRLTRVNFLGADLRQVNFSGADLYECLFLTQGQINAAIGDQQTKLPPYLKRPASWK